jgi:hypothetical protein
MKTSQFIWGNNILFEYVKAKAHSDIEMPNKVYIAHHGWPQ